MYSSILSPLYWLVSIVHIVRYVLLCFVRRSARGPPPPLLFSPARSRARAKKEETRFRLSPHDALCSYLLLLEFFYLTLLNVDTKRVIS